MTKKSNTEDLALAQKGILQANEIMFDLIKSKNSAAITAFAVNLACMSAAAAEALKILSAGGDHRAAMQMFNRSVEASTTALFEGVKP